MKPAERDPVNAAIAEVLRVRRAELELTLNDVAEASGIKFQAVQRYLQGDRPMLLSNFLALARALGLDPAEVMAQAVTGIEKSQRTSTR